MHYQQVTIILSVIVSNLLTITTHPPKTKNNVYKHFFRAKFSVSKHSFRAKNNVCKHCLKHYTKAVEGAGVAGTVAVAASGATVARAAAPAAAPEYADPRIPG